jgi:hypothetical protein
VLCTASAALAATPCDGVDRRLSKADAASLSSHIASEFHDPGSKAVESFRFVGWHIVYMEFNNSDEAFVFYRGDPLRTSHVTEWGGAAGYNEESEIRAWTRKNAPGMPTHLAACFAWHVTKGRDM